MKMKTGYQKAPIPKDEKQRLDALYRLAILDTPTEERFDRITKIAVELFDVPISTVTLVDSKREWFKSCSGLSNREGKRAISFCGYAILAPDIFIIPDAKKDPRFAKNPMVIGRPYIRFYAAVPLRSADGRAVGAFCIKDTKPGFMDAKKISLLKSLGAWAELELNTHELSRALEARRQAEAKIVALNEVLRLSNKILRHDLLNNFTVIQTRVQFIQNKKDTEKITKNILKTIGKSVNLIKQMGELESIVLSDSPLKPYNVRDVVNEIIDNYPLIEFDIKGDAEVMADAAFTSVLENIINNAKIHGETDKIEITIKDKGKFVEIRIADYGVGVPDDIKYKVFDEGFKSGPTGNSGLGLYIVKKTIDRYGGQIHIENNKPKGAIFVIKLSKDTGSRI